MTTRSGTAHLLAELKRLITSLVDGNTTCRDQCTKVPPSSVLEKGYRGQGSLLDREVESALFSRQIAAQELSLSGKGAGTDRSCLDIGSLGNAIKPQQRLTDNLSRFSGERSLTTFPLVDYLATSLLPRKRERCDASVSTVMSADGRPLQDVKDSG